MTQTKILIAFDVSARSIVESWA